MAVAKQKSASVLHLREETRKDERIRRTRARIDGAFVELLHRRAYGTIRVSDITKKAGVGRATFYAHFGAKDDLLRSQFDRRVAPMIVGAPSDPCLLDASALFAHVQSSPHIYKALMGPNGGTAPRLLRECFELRVRQLLLNPQDTGRGLRRSAVSRFVASSLLTVIECWLQDGTGETPQQVQALFSEFVGSGLAGGSLRRC